MMREKLIKYAQTIVTPVANALAIAATASGGTVSHHPRIAKIAVVLGDLRRLLAKTESTYSGSNWPNREAALVHIDMHLAGLAKGSLDHLDDLKVLFAPTGELHEISIDSGWGDEFLELASRFDAAVRGL